MMIRFAEKKDIPCMLDLLLQVGAVHHDARPDLFRDDARKYDETDLERLLADPDRPIFAADIDGKMVGYAFCVVQITKNNPVLKNRRVLYIDDLCVDAACRGKNVAKPLYEAVLAFARAKNFDAVTLNVWAGNNRALRFYEKCGFQTQKTGMEIILNR